MNKDYILQASILPFGNKLFIPCVDRKSSMKIRTQIANLALEFAKIDSSMQLLVSRDFQSSKYWVIIQKLPPSNVVWEKDQVEGSVPAKIELNPEMTRVKSILIQDGKNQEEIESILKEMYNEDNNC